MAVHSLGMCLLEMTALAAALTRLPSSFPSSADKDGDDKLSLTEFKTACDTLGIEESTWYAPPPRPRPLPSTPHPPHPPRPPPPPPLHPAPARTSHNKKHDDIFAALAGSDSLMTKNEMARAITKTPEYEKPLIAAFTNGKRM